MKFFRFLLLTIFIFLFSCSNQNKVKITITNPINAHRENETIEIDYSEISKLMPNILPENIQVKNSNNEIIPSQKIDCNSDGNLDLLLFQTDLSPKGEASFYLVSDESQKFPTKTYARFVPEREDDFAWENDQIAYRMYSKKLAAKENVDSGVDVWVKSVPKLIINEWYKSEDYHEDHGEGLDFYKVGPSRGCGGLGIYEDGKIYGTGGFSDYTVIANGPIRSVFELQYDAVVIDGKSYKETRRIVIDAGWNLNKIISKIETTDPFQVVTGLKIHKEQGEGFVTSNIKDGYISFWEPATAGNGDLGTAIVMKAKNIQEIKELEEHHVAISKVKNGEKFVYYSGAGWSKSNNFSNKKEWDDYVKNKALCINNPVIVKIN